MKPDEISTIADTVTALATTGAVVIAGLGLNAWRKQLKGTTEYELAKRLLLQVYQLRDALQYTRHPFLMLGEAGDIPDDLPWEVAAYNNRWKAVREAMVELNAMSLECEVIWGTPIVDLMGNLRSHVATLRNAVELFNTTKLDPTFKEDFTKEVRDTLYSRGDDDHYNTQLKKLITQFEDYAKPHLSR